MNLKAYPEYVDTGLTWLGQVPVDWKLKRLGFFFDERREKVSDKDYLPLSVTKNGIVPQIETAAKTDDGDNRKKVCHGDFVINSRSDRKGSSGISPLDGSVSLINTVLRPRKEVIPAYVHYLLRSVPFQEEFYRYGKGIVADLWSTNYSEMSNISLAMPSRQEQTTIANFLDRETAKIDALIAEQEKLIELLAEKRRATISRAVTKGLNPNVPMKDSGVEWLGEFPAHWEVKKLKHVAKFYGGGTPSRDNPSFWGGDIPWVSPKDMKREFIDSSEECITKEGVENSTVSLVERGCVLMVVRSGILQHTIPVGINVVPVTLNQDMKSIRFESGVCLCEFFLRWVQGWNDFLLRAWSKQGATVESLEQSYLAETLIPMPSIDEQTSIVSYVRTKTEAFDSLSAKAEQGIALLKERRTALISAAVTGKIDVRNLVEKEAA